MTTTHPIRDNRKLSEFPEGFDHAGGQAIASLEPLLFFRQMSLQDLGDSLRRGLAERSQGLLASIGVFLYLDGQRKALGEEYSFFG